MYENTFDILRNNVDLCKQFVFFPISPEYDLN